MAIVPMKKIHVFLQSKDALRSLERLRALDLVHVEHLRDIAPGHVHKLRETIAHLTKIIEGLTLASGKDLPAQEELKDWRGKIDELLLLFSEDDALKEGIVNWESLITRWQDWGNFDPRDFEFLAKRGLVARVCEVPAKALEQMPRDVICEIIHTSGKVVRCLIISRGPVKLPFETLALPEYGLNQMRDLREAEKKKLDDIRARLRAEAKYLRAFERKLVEQQDVLRFEEIALGMRQDSFLAVLKGYCPVESVPRLQAAARSDHWGLLIEDPGEEDHVPTLLRNPRWVDLSKPVLKIIEILPGYREADISMVFLIFFTLFFAILIGDAGYGLVFGAVTAFAYFKFKDTLKDKTAFILLAILTAGTIIWGILTGTYFGQAWLPPAVKPVMPWLNDTSNIQWLCFTIALAHLNIARLWAMADKWPSFLFLSELGWILNIWGMYFLANMFVLGHEFPAFAKWFFILGIPMAFFFMVPARSLLKSAPQELIPFILGVIGAGTDIISYVRLFAVGLATVAVADAANSMLRADLPGGLNYFLFIFLHILNMILAVMAILVHAVRLNVLEFSGHLGLQWKGHQYSPFGKRSTITT